MPVCFQFVCINMPQKKHNVITLANNLQTFKRISNSWPLLGSQPGECHRAHQQLWGLEIPKRSQSDCSPHTVAPRSLIEAAKQNNFLICQYNIYIYICIYIIHDA